MKKIFLGLALGAASMVSAQIDLSQTRFGVIGGPNYSRVRNAHNPSGPRYTFQAGALALIPLGGNDQFFLQPEVVYYGAGESGKDKNAVGKPGYDAMYANNYISVPVYFKAYFSEAESEFFGMLGPRFNFLVNQKVTNPPTARPYYDPATPQGDLSGKAATFNFAVGAGVGYSYKRKLEAAVRYDAGISNTYPKLIELKTGDERTKLSKSQQILSVTLSYIFD